MKDGKISRKIFVDAQNLDPKLASLKEQNHPVSIALQIIDEFASK